MGKTDSEDKVNEGMYTHVHTHRTDDIMEYMSHFNMDLDPSMVDTLVEFNSMAFDDMLDEIGVTIERVDPNSCFNCGSTKFVEDFTRGIVVCGCGQVVDSLINYENEKTFFEDDEGKARCSIMHNKLLPQSSMGTALNIKGKLRKLQIWCSMPYKERSNNILYKKIDAVCSTYKIPQTVKYDAQVICQKVSNRLHTKGFNKGKPIITRGRNREGIVGGSLYISCRKNGCARSAREISEYFGIEEADINKGVSAIVCILKGDPIVRDIGTSKVTDFIKRKCDELRIKNIDAVTAITIGRNLDRLGLASNHTTYALAAGAILLMADINKIEHIDKNVLSEHFSQLTSVTIGKTYNQIQNKRDILVDDVITTDIVRRIKEKRKIRTISKEVYTKMVEFNVDTSKYVVEGEQIKQKPQIMSKVKSTVDDDDDNADLTDTDSDRTDHTDHTDHTIHIVADQLGPEDIRDIITIIKEQTSRLELSRSTMDGTEYAEYANSISMYKAMIIEYIEEYPETLKLEGIDRGYFLKKICTVSQKKYILSL